MRVLHAAEVIKGGVSTVMRQLIEDQKKWDKIKNISCVIPDAQVQELSPHNYGVNVNLFSRKNRSLMSMLSFMKVFFLVILKDKPNIVHLHSTFAGVLGRIILILLYPFYRPSIVYCPHAFSFLMESKDIKRKMYISIERTLSLVTDRIICVSQYEYDSAIDAGICKNKLCIIHNGVPIRERKEKELSGKIRGLFVGRLDYQKGFDILLSSFKKTNNKNIELTVVGAAQDGSVNTDRVEGIRYLGWISPSDIESYYRQSDVVFVPSRWEGFAMVPLEAMSYGVPVVASNNTSFPEIVFDSENGYLFESNSVKSLVDVLNSLDEKNLAMMGKNAYAIHTSKFCSSIMLNKVRELYLGL